jgi:acyl-CoA synthetase (AMP-forming)/AMP-acid ligase II
MSAPVHYLSDLITRNAERVPAQRAYTFVSDAGESVLSYSELHARARALGAHLQSQNLTGERALLLFEPGLEFVVAFFACQLAGVIAVPAYPPEPARLARTLPRLTAVVRDSAARGLLTTQHIKAAAPMLGGIDPALDELAWIATDQPFPEGPSLHEPTRTPEDTAFLQYTSGSTGTPKGVVVSHAQVLANVAQLADTTESRPSDVFCSWVPFYHDMGLVGGILLAP